MATRLNITATVDPGTDIGDAFIEAVRLASLLRVDIEFTFNEVKCIAMPFGDAQGGVDEYHASMESKKSYKLAFARRPNQ